jgi:hypothetical protein
VSKQNQIGALYFPTDDEDDDEGDFDEETDGDEDIDDGELENDDGEDELDADPAGARRLVPLADRVRWGDSQVIAIALGAAPVTAQLLSTNLPRPMICSVRVHAEVVRMGPTGFVHSTVELIFGVGSSSAKYTRTYNLQPTPAADLEVTIPDQPLTALQGRITATGSDCDVRYTLAIAPTVKL